MSNRTLFTVLFIIGLVFSVKTEQTRYNRFTVLRITPQTSQQLNYLKELSENNLELDFWTYPSSVNRTVDIMIPPHLKQSLGTVFQQKSFTFNTMISDVEELLEEQRREAEAKAPAGYFEKYQRYADVLAFINTLRQENPSIVSQESIGKSTEGRDIVVMKIRARPAQNNPICFIDSTIHAREWITTSTIAYIVDKLLTQYKSGDLNATTILNNFDLYVILILNPDGYEFTHTTTRMWRKTRSANLGSTCIGTDGNRNYNANWMVAGASNNPCSDTYAGRNHSSEPEVKAHSDYVTSLKSLPNTKLLYLTTHSYSQLFLSPYGHTAAYPPNNADLVAKSKVFTDAIYRQYRTTYRSGTSTNVLYSASGNGCDYAYLNGGFPYSYTIELRDTGTYGFALPVSQINPSGEETYDGVCATLLALHSSP